MGLGPSFVTGMMFHVTENDDNNKMGNSAVRVNFSLNNSLLLCVSWYSEHCLFFIHISIPIVGSIL